MEVWKPVVGYEQYYQISNKGRVKSLYKNGKTKILRPKQRRDGYYIVSLANRKGGIKYAAIHRLVGKAFIPNINNYPQINHKDGIKTNNNVENLEWCTKSQNMRHAYDIGLSSWQHNFKSELMFILNRRYEFTQKEIADLVGCHVGTVERRIHQYRKQNGMSDDKYDIQR